jgi:hypothetical protein
MFVQLAVLVSPNNYPYTLCLIYKHPDVRVSSHLVPLMCSLFNMINESTCCARMSSIQKALLSNPTLILIEFQGILLCQLYRNN